jgi:hypothetical protein
MQEIDNFQLQSSPDITYDKKGMKIYRDEETFHKHKKIGKYEAKASDECYTPIPVMNAIDDFVCKKFGVRKEQIIKPFKPNGDYTAEDYTNRVVVDNPPFSILTEISKFYIENNIKFFLFGPTLTYLTTIRTIEKHHGVKLGAIMPKGDITYHNGLHVCTIFLHNFNSILEYCPELFFKKQGKKTEKAILPYNITNSAKSVALLRQIGKITNYSTIAKNNLHLNNNKEAFGHCIVIHDEDYVVGKNHADDLKEFYLSNKDKYNYDIQELIYSLPLIQDLKEMTQVFKKIDELCKAEESDRLSKQGQLI